VINSVTGLRLNRTDGSGAPGVDRPGHHPHFVAPIHLACPLHMTGESGSIHHLRDLRRRPALSILGGFTYKAQEISSANLQFYGIIFRHNDSSPHSATIHVLFFMSPLLCVVLHVPANRSAGPSLLRGARFQDGFYGRLVVGTPSGLPLTLSVNKG
jgi:hypothetical protein